MRIAHQCRTTLVILTAGWAVLASAPPTFAVDPTAAASAGTVTGAGSALLERRPELLRVQFEVNAEAATMKEALAQLRTKEKAAREKLAKLGAADAAVRVDEPRAVVEGQDPQAQMNRMLRMRMGQGQNRPATGPAQPAVKVAARVRAEWKLAAAAADDLLVEAQELSAKIKAADLPAKGPKKALSPEEQEEAEEQALLAEGQGGDAAEMVPQFISRVSDEDRAKLLAEAFGRARRDAARLAKAAGAELGPIRQLTGTVGTGEDGGDASNPYSQMVRAQMQMMSGGAQAQPQSDDPEAAEAVGTAPGRVSYRVAVSASFAIR